ncbi:hypothetical protein N801_15895 [Knoellia aerolata DSM 18566]|uniref:Uncharacterized protein n=2 Tax=Knoellia TaxID=136099 RepID=A0A0A0K0S0_9MICO|nr:hypothetical protein N801_15895 [Knoellia aerolata DSM 18566]
MLVALVLPVFLGPLPAARADAGGVQLKPIGTPSWQPVDCHLFSAPVGTAASGYAEASDTVGRLLPPPDHVPRPPLLAIGPGAAHTPPYDTELGDGIRALGFHRGHRFTASEFSEGAGVFLVCMVVPDPGVVGSSPDFASGPIIPNSTFPIHVEGVATRNGDPFDPFLTNFDVPPLTTSIDPAFDVDGHSHFPIFVATNADFGPADSDLRGRYVYRFTMVDASGAGWTVGAHFVVRP